MDTSPTTARPWRGCWGTLHAGQSISISANLHTAADRDFFQFNLGTGATATVVLSGIQTGSDFDLYAYRADHSLLTSSTTRGTGSETITIQSDPAQALTSFILEVRSVTWSAASPSYSLLISAAASTTAGDGSGTTGTGTSQTSPLNPVAVPLPQTPAKLTLPPAVISITPNTMICGQELVVKVVGQNTNWASNHTHIGFSSDISASYTDVQDATHATAKIDCHGQELISSGGTATVYMNTDGQRVGSQSPIFTLLGQPIVTAINPSTGHQGDQNLTVTLTTKNANAVQGSTTAYFGDGITVNSLQIAPNSATAVITIAPTAPLGTYYPALKTNGVS
ncbi:MAG TPA: hypothetical protein VLK33_13260, partial [Terriglobales bacterium]|nr:hypothetical protein [Terriglobales bacterium]